MDKQEAKLRAQLQGTGVSVTRNGNDLILNMPGNITFKTASADLNAGFYKVLDSVSLVLKEFDKTLVDVEGHTDNVGDDNYNQNLSVQRASSVGSYLQSHGVNSQRIVTLGAGRVPSGGVKRHRQMAVSRIAASSSSCSPLPRADIVSQSLDGRRPFWPAFSYVAR